MVKRFDSKGRVSATRKGREMDLDLEDLERGKKETEYTIEPELINHKGGSPRPSPRAKEEKQPPLLSASRSVQFTPVPPSSSSSSSSYPARSSSFYSSYSQPLQPPSVSPYSSASFTTAPAPTLGPVASSHSNVAAVFGKPVKFGSWDKSGHAEVSESCL